MSLGEKVKEKREKRGMNQKQLAEASGISQATISRIESEKVKELKSQALRRLADALGVTVDYLVDKTDKLTPNEIVLSDPTAQEIFRAYEKLSSDRRRQLGDFVRFLEHQQAEEWMDQKFRELLRLAREQAAKDGTVDPILDWVRSARKQEASYREPDLLQDFVRFLQNHEADEMMPKRVREFMRFLQNHEADETIPGGCSCSTQTHLGNDPSRPG